MTSKTEIELFARTYRIVENEAWKKKHTHKVQGTRVLPNEERNGKTRNDFGMKAPVDGSLELMHSPSCVCENQPPLNNKIYMSENKVCM